MSEKAEPTTDDQKPGPKPPPGTELAAIALVAEKLGEFTSDLDQILSVQHDQTTAHELDRHSQRRHRLLLVALLLVAIVLGGIGVNNQVATHHLLREIENVIDPRKPGYQANQKAQQKVLDQLDHCAYVEAWAADHGQPEQRC